MSTYYERNKEKVLEYQNKRYQDKKEELLEYQNKYRKSNPLRSVWNSIKQRCYNPKHKDFKDYGGRDIIMCNEWLNNYEVFKEWCLENGYEKGLQIDRINNNGNYCPLNCQFITQAENLAIGKKRKQTNNTSGYVGVTFYKSTGKYKAQIRHNKKQIYLGYFTTPEEACEARINKEIELFGEQRTNL